MKHFNRRIAILLCVFVFLPLTSFAASSEGELSEKIDTLREQISNIEKRVTALNQNLEDQRKQAQTLEQELTILDAHTETLNLQVVRIEKQIEQTGLEIKAVQDRIQTTEREISKAKQQIAQYLRALWRVEETSPLEIIFLHDSLSEVFGQLTVLTSLQAEVGNRLEHLKLLKTRLEHEKQSFETKKRDLETLKNAKQNDLGRLERQEDSKKLLLLQTKTSEAAFKKFVQELQAEQSQIDNEIVQLERTLRLKRAGTGTGPTTFIWPVPNNGITASFRDPTYPFRRFFEHNAIDIRAKQKSPIKAAASGEVAIAKDNGLGYSYILIVHDNGFSSLYGHVSRILVEKGQAVAQGEIIALSGGLPGTPGAGRLSTGAHLHLEMRKDGSYLDPLAVLP